MVKTPIRNLFKVKSGEGISVASLSTYGKYPVYGGNGIAGYTDRYNTNAGTMLIGRVGEKCGNVNISNSRCWVSDNALIVTPLSNYNQLYMKYLMEYTDLNNFANRNAQPVISGQIIYAIEVPYFENNDEQTAIANLLDDFDSYIANLSELIEKKKVIRDGALEDLVNGRTRLEGYDTRWIEVPFSKVITPKARIGWQGLRSEEYLRKGYSYLIGGTDFCDGTISTDHIWFVSEDRYAMDTNIQVSENDVLVTKDGTIGKVAIVPHLERPATLNSGVYVFRTKNGLTPKFLYRVLQSTVFRKFIDTLAAGSTIVHLYQKDLKNFNFMMPEDKMEQDAIASVLTAMDEEIKALEGERNKIIQIREGAMDDLLTGRVRLPI